MADAANLRAVRVQYLVLDDSPANLRDVRIQTLEDDAAPVSIRRVSGQVLTRSKDPVNLRAGRLQVMEDSASPASVRRVTAQVLIRPRDPINVASVRVQYLEIDNPTPDFRLAAWPKILETINNNNGFNFTQAMLLPGTPEVSTDPRYWNTKLEVTATPLSGFSGKMYIYFQRYDISVAFDRLAPLLDLSTANTVHDVLGQLNTNYDLSLTAADVENSPINRAAGTFTLTVKPGSWYFVPGSKFDYQNIYDMRNIFPKQDLLGWDLPASAGGIRNPVVGVNGIYDVVADDGSTFKAYCDMTTDGGYWIQVGHWTGVVPTQPDIMMYSECMVIGQDISGYSSNTTQRPVIPAGKLKNFNTEWMLQHDHPGWIGLYGAWQVGKTVPMATPLWKSGTPVPVRTPLGNKNLYGQRDGWYMDTLPTDNFGFFTTVGPGGPCGGAGVAGNNRMCPISDWNGNWGAHADYTYNKRFFIRALNYKP